jgi:hypothetical protein
MNTFLQQDIELSCLLLQDLIRMFKSHALGEALMKSNILDVNTRNLLVDILANDMVVNFGR